MAGPLDGVKVVEFTEIIAAPFAGMLLSDMGAEVIKVEPPWGDPWRTAYPFSETEGRPFLAYNRGKRDITLDLTSPESQGVLERLIPTADVVLANYRPDVAAKLGVDYETLARLNPRLIYCENTAFGRQGPDAHRPGYDVMLQAMSGLMAAEAKLDGENLQHIVSSPVIDTAAGFCLAWCVCGALFSREKTGRGQKIESTLLGTALALMGMRFFHVEELDRDGRAETLQVLDTLRKAGVPFPELLEVYESRNNQLRGTIYYRTYQTATGTIAVGCLSDPLRKRLLDALGLHDIRFDDGYDPSSPEAVQFAEWLKVDAEERFRQRSSEEWLELLESRGVPAGPVRFVEELFDDPQVVANGLVADLEHPEAGTVKMVGAMANFSETPLETRPPAALGQHTDEVLAELGYSSDEVRQWRERGIIR